MAQRKKRDGSKRKNKKRVNRIDRQSEEINWEWEYEKFQRRKKKDPKKIRDMYDEIEK